MLIGGAFERLFCPEGREFEEANLRKFKCPGGCRGGMLNFRIDRRICTASCILSPPRLANMLFTEDKNLLICFHAKQ